MAEPRDVAEINKAIGGLIRAWELLAEKYSTWSPETGTVFSDRYSIEAIEGINTAREILAALRSPGLDRDGERMRERCIEACMDRASTIRARAERISASHERAAAVLRGKATEAEACAGAIRAIAHEEKAGC